MWVIRAGAVLYFLCCVIACSPTAEDVEAYGIERFTKDALTSLGENTVSSDLVTAFEPIAVESYLDGVLLVMKDGKKYRQGIYVSSSGVDGWGGSGVEVTGWYTDIAWVKIKKRVLAQRFAEQE